MTLAPGTRLGPYEILDGRQAGKIGYVFGPDFIAKE